MNLPPIHSAAGRDLSDDDADKQDEELERSDRTEDWRGLQILTCWNLKPK